MNTHFFVKNGYHYFLVPKEDGYYWLMSDADFALQYLRTNEHSGVIISITKDETVLLTLGQKFSENSKEKTIQEIIRIEANNSMFKVKLE